MAGQDEKQARGVLAVMLERITRGPHEALGIPGDAEPAEVRAAFLELTKTYHPARFARREPDTQKLATEVFLALRAAHDSLARPARTSANHSGGFPIVQPPQARSGQSGAMPPIRQSSTGAMPPLRPTGSRPATAPRLPTSSGPVTRSTGSQATQPLRAARPGEDLDRPQRLPSASPPPPVHGQTAPRSSHRTSPPALARPSGAQPPLGRPGADSAIELMNHGQWDQARAMLEALAAKEPDAPKYRALLAYARGREAQLEHRLDEARIELMTALQIDPELQLAKTALGELFTRRK